MSRLASVLCGATLVLLVFAMPARLTAQASHACDLVNASDLATHLGRKELANARNIRGTSDQSQPGGAVDSGGTECAFLGTSVTVELQRLVSLDRFNAAIPRRVQAGELQPYQGLGDAAWFRNNKGLGQHGFMVRSGDRLVTVMMNTDEAGSADNAKSQLLPLARAVVAKLR